MSMPLVSKLTSMTVALIASKDRIFSIVFYWLLFTNLHHTFFVLLPFVIILTNI